MADDRAVEAQDRSPVPRAGRDPGAPDRHGELPLGLRTVVLLQQRAGNRAVAGLLQARHTGTRPPPTPAFVQLQEPTTPTLERPREEDAPAESETATVETPRRSPEPPPAPADPGGGERPSGPPSPRRPDAAARSPVAAPPAVDERRRAEPAPAPARPPAPGTAGPAVDGAPLAQEPPPTAAAGAGGAAPGRSGGATSRRAAGPAAGRGGRPGPPAGAAAPPAPRPTPHSATLSGAAADAGARIQVATDEARATSRDRVAGVRLALLDAAGAAATEMSQGLEAAVSSLHARFGAARAALHVTFGSARAAVAAHQVRAVGEIGAAEEESLAALGERTAAARAQAQERAAAEAAAVTEAGSGGTRTVDERTTRDAGRVGAAARAAIAPYAGDSTSRGPVTGAVDEAAAEILAKLHERSDDVRGQVLEITGDAAPRFVQLGSQLAADLGTGEADVRAGIQDGAQRARAAVDEQAAALHAQLSGLEVSSLTALAQQEATAESTLRLAGEDAIAEAESAGTASVQGFDRWAAEADDALLGAAVEAEAQLEEGGPAGADLDGFAAGVAELVSTEAGAVAGAAQAQGAELTERHRTTAAATTAALGSGVQTVGDQLDQQVGQVGSTVAAVPAQFAETADQVSSQAREAFAGSVEEFAGGLEARIEEEAAGWATERQAVVTDVAAKVDEGLAPNEQLAAESPGALARVATEAHDEAHASLLEQIGRGILGAVGAFVLGLLAIALVALVIFVGLVLVGVIALSFKAFLVVFAVVGLVALVVFGVMAIAHRWEQMRQRLGEDAPWWALTLGFLGAVVVGVGDVVGVVPIIEGIWGYELISGRELSAEERAFRITFGVLSVAALLLLRGRGGRAPAGRGARPGGGGREVPGGGRGGGRTRPPVEERPPQERTPTEERPPGRERTPTEELPGACFLAGTPVLTPHGAVPIEHVAPGDLVVTRDHGGAAGTQVRAVTACPRGRTRTTVEIRAGAGGVVATPGHPFAVAGSGWVAARELTAGTLLDGLSGGPVPVEATVVRHHTDQLPTYNLSVEGTRAYFVRLADRWVLVHNITLEQIQGVVYWLLGTNPRLRPDDTDGMSIWRTDNQEQAREFWRTRVAAGQGKSNHAFFTEAQFQAELAAKGLEAPRTPGQGPLAAVLPDGHHSVRPEGTGQVGPDGRLADLSPTQMETLTQKVTSLETSGKTKFNPTVCG